MSLRWPPVFMYHSVAQLAHDPNMLCTSPERFEAQMLSLKRRGLRGVSMRELVQRMDSRDTGGLVGLTFDDAYKDFLTTAVPLLDSLGFSATVFAVAGMLGEENDWEHTYSPRPRLKLLTAEELRAVKEHGMEVGSHSMTHPKLSGLAPERLDREVSDSRHILSEALGEEVKGFCYPYGNLDGAALRSVQRAGYAYACAWNTYVEHSVYDIPRIPISDRDSHLRFVAKLKSYSQYSRVKGVFSALHKR